MTETFPCGCPWRHRRVGSLYPEVHSPECRERTRAHARQYRQAAHARYDTINTVVFSQVPIIVEGLPDEPRDDVIDRERPVAIPPPDVSWAAHRVFQSSAPPPAADWASVCLWWLLRLYGLLPSQVDDVTPLGADPPFTDDEE